MRYLVVGTSGAGKSTFGAKLAAATQCPHIELDSHYWGPQWQAVPPDQFMHSVASATQGAAWVADGNYSAVRLVLWSRATHVVWLNYGRSTVFSRLLWRTLRRGLTRTLLSHGNRESLRMAFFSKDSILLWALSTYSKNQSKFAALCDSAEFTHLEWTELTEPSQASALLEKLAAFTPLSSGAHLRHGLRVRGLCPTPANPMQALARELASNCAREGHDRARLSAQRTHSQPRYSRCARPQ